MRTFVREKKIYCGDEYLEVDIFNYTQIEEEKTQKGERSKKEVDSTLKQVDWNDINSRRRFLQLVHANFGDEELHVSLAYENKTLPQSLKAAEREEKNFLRRVAYARNKKGLQALKYLAIPACVYKKDGVTPARIHHHIIMNGGLERDEIEDLWRKRRQKGQRKGDKIGYANADRLQPGENGLVSICEYLAKQAGGKKRWTSSHGLEKPTSDVINQYDPISDVMQEVENKPISELVSEVKNKPIQEKKKGKSTISNSLNLERPWSRTNDHRFSRKELQKIATAPQDTAYWEKRYPGYTLMGEGYGFKAVYSETRGWALYLKLRKIS